MNTVLEPIEFAIQNHKANLVAETIKEPWAKQFNSPMGTFALQRLVNSCIHWPEELESIWQEVEKDAGGLEEEVQRVLAGSFQRILRANAQLATKLADVLPELSLQAGSTITGERELRDAALRIEQMDQRIFLGMDLDAAYKAVEAMRQGKVFNRRGQPKQSA